MQLSGKVAVVTGASRGIGKAIALALAEEGADVVCTSRTTESAPSKLPGTNDETAQQIQAMGRRALAIGMDLTKDEDIDAMARRVLDELGKVDILVNNSGISFSGPTLEVPVKRWDLVLAVNLRGAYLCIKAFAPGMVERQWGHIINISSAAARSIGAGRLSYSVSKVALDKLTVGLAAEMATSGVAVNAIEVERAIATEGFMFLNPGADYSTWLKPESCGPLAVWIASQDPKQYTGHVVTMEELEQARAATQP